MNQINNREKGQVLVLLTVGIITLLGFTALAIDGGRLYAERRTVQGVTDTSSLTGALYIAQQLADGVDSGDIDAAEAAAYQRAANNGYEPPVISVEIMEDTWFYYVRTTIHSSIPPTIAQIVFNGPLKVTATSEARVPKYNVFALGQALFSISKIDCPGIDFGGNSDMVIDGTGIFSSSECDSSVLFHGDPNVDIDGTVSAVGEIEQVGSFSVISEGEHEEAAPYTIDKINEPDCSDLPIINHDNAEPLQPGIYPNGIHLTGNASRNMEAGLYCLDAEFRVDSADSTLTGEGVTIFMREGGFHINGGTIRLTAPSDDLWLDGNEKAWNGMLIFYAYDNYDTVAMNGTADSYFEGTIFNYNDLCRINGTGSLESYNTQVVCNTIELMGMIDVGITYIPEEEFIPPTKLDLME
ncbi:MAG: Tad domain-containing protein [Anaerolineales bacterium]